MQDHENTKNTNNVKNKEEKSDLVFGVAKKGKGPSWQQSKYFFQVLDKKDKSIAYVAFTLLICALIGIIGYTYFYFTEAVPKEGGEYTEALVGYPEHINPVLAQTNDVDMDISRLVFSGLFKYNEKQELMPDLVDTYEISEDQLEYTFTIKEGAQWHDGDSLDIDDIVFTINSIQDENFQSPLLPSLRGTVTEKVDNRTFKIILKEPFAPFLSTLTFGILPKHIWYDAYSVSAQNVLLTEYNLKPIGSGPFEFDQLVKDKAGNIKSYHLKRNDDYYDQTANLDKVSFIFYPDIDTAVEAAASKKVEGVSFVPFELKGELKKRNRNIEFHSLRLPQYTAIFFNQKEGEDNVLAYKAVREALVWGVDRDRIISEVLEGDGEPIYAPVLPGYVGYNEDIEKFGFDIENGKKILEDGGWSLPEGEKYRTRNDRLLEFTIVTVDSPEYLQTLEILKENWEEMGVKLNVDTFSVEDIQTEVLVERKYEALLFGEIVGTDPDPYPFWHSSQTKHPGLNLSIPFKKLKDVDQLLEEARKITDDEARAKKYYHFQNILVEELPAIFLYNPNYNYAVHKKIKGIESQYITIPSDRFAGVENWYIKTDRKWKSKDEEETVKAVDLPEDVVVEEEATEEEVTEEETTEDETAEEESEETVEDEDAKEEEIEEPESPDEGTDEETIE